MKNLVFIGVCVAFLFAACSKNNNAPTQKLNVYVAGNSGGDTAIYWKNGQRVTLNPGNNSYSAAIAVSGGNVYVAGQMSSPVPGGGYLFVYWQNEQLNVFSAYGSTSGPNYIDGRATNGIGITNGIAVSGSDVYVLANGNGYWKNGQLVIFEDYYNHTTLVDSTYVGYGTGIAVSGSDVYISGQYIGFVNDLPYSETAAYRKNEQHYELLPNSAVTAGIALSGSDVYVAGYTSGDSAVYWKNGQLVVLSPHAIATGIAVSGGNVYVSGYTSGNTAVYWKNGQQITLSNNGEAKGIVVSGNDVYVCGIAGYNSYQYPPYYAAYNTAVYWKNGQEVVLGANAGATSIAVE
jgi:glutamate synthase domain-containing protein 3